jgi:ribosomal-protein-alanine N-acetyltransferase
MTPERVTPRHLGAIAALEREAFAHPWSEKALELLCTESAIGFVLMDGARAAAYGGMMCVAGEGQITNIATSPDYRRQGLAQQAMGALVAAARERGLCEISLEVRESNIPAISLYEKFGFAAMGKRPRFYTSPVESAIVMVLSLDGEN